MPKVSETEKRRPLKSIKNLLKRSIEILKPMKIVKEEKKEADSKEIVNFYEDILKYQLTKEKNEQLDVNLLANTPVSVRNRKILVQWMWDMKEMLELEQGTFELAVAIMDRSMALVRTVRKDLQNLGLAALFVARKIEEAEDFEGGFDKDAILRMEAQILEHLRFRLNLIVPSHFLCYFQSKIPEKVLSMATYFVNVSLLNGLNFLPSILAETSLHLASEILTFPMETVASKSAQISLAKVILEHQENTPNKALQDHRIVDYLQMITST